MGSREGGPGRQYSLLRHCLKPNWTDLTGKSAVEVSIYFNGSDKTARGFRLSRGFIKYPRSPIEIKFAFQHGNPLSYFSFQPVLHDWCNKGRGMCYPVCGMMHIKEPLLLIGKSSPCGGSGVPLSLYEWFFTICLTPYNRK